MEIFIENATHLAESSKAKACNSLDTAVWCYGEHITPVLYYLQWLPIEL